MKRVLPLALICSLIVPSAALAQWNTPARVQLKTLAGKKLGKDKTGEFQPFFGDHNGDGLEDALIFAYYSEADGGNSIYLDVMLFNGTSTGFKFVKVVPNVYGQDPRAAQFGNGFIKITTTTTGPNDARCCPTLKKTYTISTR